ncbi:MAG TPA: glutamyl-tRNA reductase [Gemmatimonadales bacterium]
MARNLSFHLIGVSHHTTPVEVRERFAFSPHEISAILELLKADGIPAVLLSTCNRCELYWSGSGEGETWFHRLRRQGADPMPDGLVITRHEGMAAARHLFRVCSGLDSQILGEVEVLGQVRRAYDFARAAGATTREMDLIFSAALAAGRRARRETLLGRHPSSVSSAAVDLVLQQWQESRGPEVVVLGAGEAAEGVLRAFNQLGVSQVTLLSRAPEKAGVLAAAWGAKAGSLVELESRLPETDILMVATASSRPVVRAVELSRAIAARSKPKLVVVDLGVPRNVEPESRGIPGVELLDLDDLQRLCCPAAASPATALADAEGIIEDELIRLGLALRGRTAASRLAELHQISQQMAEQESEWALAQLETLSPAERDVVRKMADRLVRRVLFPLSQNLRVET